MDVLSILRHGVSGADIAARASSVHDRFIALEPEIRQKVILDPRVVSRLEAIQRLILEHGNSALSDAEWIESTNFLLRIEVFCLLASGETGSLSVTNNGDNWHSIPGTGFYLPANHGAKEIHVRQGKLMNPDAFDGKLERSDDQNKITLALPERAMTPPIEGKCLLHLTTADREKWSNALGNALSLISLDEPSLKLVEEYTWFLVPLQNDQAGYFSSISFNSFPNAIYATLHSDLMFAETFVHESDHQWLYSHSRSESFWMAPEYEQKAEYRSPWREDPRPLDGILRGASAFVRVGSFWTSLADALPKSKKDHRWIQARAILSNFQAVDALRTVNEFGKPSNFGEQLIGDLCRSARRTRSQLMVLSDFSDLVKLAGDTQHSHDDQWAQSHTHLADKTNKLEIEDYFNF